MTRNHLKMRFSRLLNANGKKPEAILVVLATPEPTSEASACPHVCQIWQKVSPLDLGTLGHL